MERIKKMIAFIFLFVAGNNAISATITINVSGVITLDAPEISSIGAGDHWRAELFIDSNTPNNSPNNNNTQGFYYGLTGDIYIGDTWISHIDGSGGAQYPYPVVLVEDDYQPLWVEDEISFFGNCCTSSPLDDYTVQRFSIILRDSNFYERETSHTNPLSSHDLTEIISVSSLDPFQDSRSDLLLFILDLYGYDSEMTILGSVGSYNASISEVPIPASIFLFLSGIFSIAGMNIKRSKKAKPI
jgi:hypothetical protein